ncbi:SDR family oxidoreductase [Chroococcidiopsis sp. FACHB-1243]|uniref:SDR family oxidoreductase n=1 Tax=Chroococcidiopsis sp. [FACHB-1243] TaxID=2692781 RepID=UPI001784090A|nr:SDR family oxidoreductase [Chroococcidiopsis sp. [FACHB-1243]]MBD2305958.1 SDR family oxidoreductase [Chroococcidiopsis sp. [FACHB-1243]]
MISVRHQIVLITGASSGIGEATAQVFAQAGAKLILVARRQERLAQLADDLNKEFASDIHTMQLDVRDRASIESALAQLPSEFSAIDVLINNAGLSRGLDKLYQGSYQDWEEMIDTNVKGLLYFTRTIVPGMVSRGRGHVVNLGSIAGHQTYPNGNVYCATKAAVKAISEGLKQDLLGTPIRVTSVDPGMVETEFSQVRFHGDTEQANKVYQGLKPLMPEDVADVIFFCVTRSPHVNISEVLMMPVDQSSSTLFNRRG